MKNNNLRRRAGAVLFSFSAMVQAPSTIVEMISDRINVSLLTELVSNSFRWYDEIQMEIESAEKTLKRSKMRNSGGKRAAGAPKNRVFSAQVGKFCF